MAAPDFLHRLRAIRRLRRRFARWPWATLAEMAARAGYAARGAVYVSLGGVALMAAVGLWPKAEGAVGALYAWGRWPAGIALLWLIGLGLYAFAGWRALQAIFDADRQGKSPKALASRAGQAISGFVYGALAVSVFGLLDAIEDLHEADDQAATIAAVQQALELPAGGLLVTAVGLFVLVAGLGSMIRAVFDHFGRHVSNHEEGARWAGLVARAGYFGRGVALLPAGAYTASAGWHARASDARGLGGALQELNDQPYGSVILALLALGLMAFGAYAFLEAWSRSIRPEHVIDG
ncbi:DUF1206 domain-containing protein [Phenylobacterium sp.]|jgi:hypothetical protein|uniref:DUF1206 domain-containing protein n=1 Tax=Phenylobacterium sp. TaxID=1871053 RepID=UPI002F95CF96